VWRESEQEGERAREREQEREMVDRETQRHRDEGMHSHTGMQNVT